MGTGGTLRVGPMKVSLAHPSSTAAGLWEGSEVVKTVCVCVCVEDLMLTLEKIN